MSVRLEPSVGEFTSAVEAIPAAIQTLSANRFTEVTAKVRDLARAGAVRAHPPAAKRPARGGQRWNELVATIQTGAEGESPSVSFGSSRIPWGPGYEFGSHQGFRKTQFPRFRPDGYFFWPAVKVATEGLEEQMGEVVDEAARKAFPD